MRKLFFGCAAVAAGLFASAVHANTSYMADFSLGWQQVNIDGSNAKELDGDDNLSGRFRLTFFPERSNWRYGFQLSGAHAYAETNPFVYKDHAYTDDPTKEFDMLVPEFRLGYNIPIGRLFVEPSIGVGVAVGSFTVGEHGNDYFDGDSFVRANLAVEPGVQVGYNGGRWAAGGEVNYIFTHLDFGDKAGGNISALYIGVFARFQF